MDHTVVHFEIPADQPERAARFYRELFGWDWMVRTVPTDAQGQPTRPGVNGGLMKRMFPGQAPVNYIAVPNVDEFIRKAERLGAKVLMGKSPVPGMGWFAQLNDTEGNVFAIWQSDAKAGQTGEPVSEEVANARR
jgi:predicted enzyme related to lactoylglutathione lyase